MSKQNLDISPAEENDASQHDKDHNSQYDGEGEDEQLNNLQKKFTSMAFIKTNF